MEVCVEAHWDYCWTYKHKGLNVRLHPVSPFDSAAVCLGSHVGSLLYAFISVYSSFDI